MIVDANSLIDGSLPCDDICVIGAGAVGIALALRLADAGVRVTLIEAGGDGRDEAVQDAYAGAVTDPDLHSPLRDYRERRLGGTSTIWGGRCMPLDPIDFTQRDWIPDSGWPIGPGALAPYYPDANRWCEAGQFDYNADSALPDGAAPMIAGFNGQAFRTDRLERFSCPTDFGRRYRQRLIASRNVRLVLDAAVTAIRLDPDGTRVRALSVRTKYGTQIDLAPRHVVLCAGGLESARLMLANRDVHPNGIGNHHDVLGRYYMSHIAGTIGMLHVTAPVWHGYDVADDGTYCRRRLSLNEEAQVAHRVGNFVARLHHPRIADPRHGAGALSALYLGRALVPRLYRARLTGEGDGGANYLRHIGNVVRQPGAVVRFARDTLSKRWLAERKYPSVVATPVDGAYMLDFHAEQEPNRDSRVMLGEERDALGMPRLLVDWRYTRGDVRTVEVALRLLAEDIRRSGCGSFDYDPDQVEREMTRYGAYPGHHIGTVRMGSDPRHSMVDADCRVHGVANLHVAGAAVFPTSSQANPTLTAVALALRLADRLAAKGAI